ncbi:hypothetical protein [Nitrosopumilus sp.]|uniref:hypothetical protein n=1 Tax=Nitrosopumilus sp. TaxID=2024843 RepID=UPI00292DEAE4|nr:hypothetical protein [Nitrosopumilus sp.]
MNYSILCNEILKLDSKIRFVGVFNSKGEMIAEKNRDASSLLSADEEKMLVHYTFARWRHLQNLEHRLGKVRTSVAKHEKVTLISLYLESDLLLLSVEPDYNYPEIIKKIRTMSDDGGYPYKKKKQTKKDLDEKITELEAKLSKLSTELGAKPVETTKPKSTILSQSFNSAQKTRKKSTVTVKRKTTAKSKKNKRSKPVSKAKRRATLVANKRKNEYEKANNKIKSLKKAIKLAEKSAKKKKTTYQQAAKRASQTR